ncbi:MAG: hypothetical protein DI539_23175 [Flavobacterium psychrophilum]|jgi:MtN3 and saliva related transmembrane protein|nr:MAG: hypothetical protein DI539_23175 [Flavobacterium psychrophilum]
MSLITLIGVVASMLTALSLIPQLIKLLREKKSEDISVTMLLVLLSGLGLWVYYGTLKEDFIIIISNSVAFLINSVTLFFCIRYKKEQNQS